MTGYVKSVLLRPDRVEGSKHLMFCVADHFEPFRRGASPDRTPGIVSDWVNGYPVAFKGFRDADGCCPRHTFFCPQDEYVPEWIDGISPLCSSGCGEIEVHLHHRNDTAEALRGKLAEFRDCLHFRHGMLGKDPEGNPRYGFVHGNWALCNSRPDGDWCGVNEELSILTGTGCYADFTFPSAPSPTQPRMVNAIYRANDTQGKPRSHDRGVRVSVRQVSGLGSHPSSLMLIQGPLGLDWSGRKKWGILPRIENGAITVANPLTKDRIDLCVKQHIHVRDRPEWVFLKVHTHGCVPGNRTVLLGEGMRRAHDHLQLRYNDGKEWFLHYVAAREMHNIIRAAEDGKRGNPGRYRDYEIESPPVSQA